MNISLVIANLKKFIDFSGRAVSWLSLVMVIVTFVVVILRYVFDVGSIAAQESITFLHAMIFLIGAAWTMQHESHVRVDIFYTRFNPEQRAWVDLCGSLFLLIPVMVFIFWISWSYVASSWDVLEGSREAGGLPGVFLLKSLLLLFTFLLIVQALIQVYTSILKIVSPQSTTDS